MPKFIITENITNYFVVEAGSEEEAFNLVSYRDSFSDNLKPVFIDAVGYDCIEPKMAPFDIRDDLS
jgi:hypothetical protein